MANDWSLAIVTVHEMICSVQVQWLWVQGRGGADSRLRLGRLYVLILDISFFEIHVVCNRLVLLSLVNRTIVSSSFF